MKLKMKAGALLFIVLTSVGVTSGKKVEKLFGYDPEYRGLEELKENKDRAATVILHGFAAPAKPQWFSRFRGIRHVSFGFRDNKFIEAKDKALEFVKKVKAGKVPVVKVLPQVAEHLGDVVKTARSVNIGQKQDAEVALYAVIECWRLGCELVNLVGISRGGAALTVVLNMLAYPDRYYRTWKKFGFIKKVAGKKPPLDRKKIDEIWTMVFRGKHFLVNPLLGLKSVLKQEAEDIVQAVIDFFVEKKIITKQLAQLLDPKKHLFKLVLGPLAIVFMTATTGYKPVEREPISILKDLAKIPREGQFALDIAQAKEDEAVGNVHDEKLRKLAKKVNAQAGGEAVWNVSYGNKHHGDNSVGWQRIIAHLYDLQQQFRRENRFTQQPTD